MSHQRDVINPSFSQTQTFSQKEKKKWKKEREREKLNFYRNRWQSMPSSLSVSWSIP